MDLTERHHGHSNRHPWETARLKALRKIVAPELFEGITVLDVGCGDGFIAQNLFDQLRRKDITAVDTQLTEQLIGELENDSGDVRFLRDMPETGRYDLVLLLDVLEHIEADQDFLAGIVARQCSQNGRVMITVPTFQALFGSHDIFLGHYRRYNLAELRKLATSCGLRILSSGYLFCSLLLPKLVLFKLLATGTHADGVGNWQRGRGITRVVECLLNADNGLLLRASRWGITLPGLTGWALCEKRES